VSEYPDTFEGDCMRYRRRILTGKYAHTCWDWDGLPIDETCEEWPCACQAELEKQVSALPPPPEVK